MALELMCTLFATFYDAITASSAAPMSGAAGRPGGSGAGAGGSGPPRLTPVTLDWLVAECEIVIGGAMRHTKPYEMDAYNTGAISGLVTLLPVLSVRPSC